MAQYAVHLVPGTTAIAWNDRELLTTCETEEQANAWRQGYIAAIIHNGGKYYDENAVEDSEGRVSQVTVGLYDEEE